MPREIFDAVQAERRAELKSALAAILPNGEGRMVLEIGCGNGHFLTAYAAAHPEQLCVGIDLRLERVEKAVRKRDRATVSNLHFLRCDARNFLLELPAGVTLSDVYLLFPDPWPKKRHHKNRLLQAPFLCDLAARAGKGSRLFFRTDFLPYFEEARAILLGHPQWRLLETDAFPFEHVTIFQSRAPSFYSLAAVRETSPAAAPRNPADLPTPEVVPK